MICSFNFYFTRFRDSKVCRYLCTLTPFFIWLLVWYDDNDDDVDEKAVHFVHLYYWLGHISSPSPPPPPPTKTTTPHSQKPASSFQRSHSHHHHHHKIMLNNNLYCQQNITNIYCFLLSFLLDCSSFFQPDSFNFTKGSSKVEGACSAWSHTIISSSSYSHPYTSNNNYCYKIYLKSKRAKYNFAYTHY